MTFQFFALGLLLISIDACTRPLVKQDQDLNIRHDSIDNDQSKFSLNTFTFSGTILNSSGRSCEGVFSCLSDSGVVIAVLSDQNTGAFSVKLNRDQAILVNAIRGTARGGYDTLVDHFDATQLVDSLIVRNFVLTKAKPKFTIIYQYNEHGGATGIPVDTIWLDENGNIDLRPNKEH